MGLLTSALDRLTLSNSLKYSQSGRSLIERVYVAFAANSDVCLTFIRQCADYGEKVFSLCLDSIASPTSSRAGVSDDLRERTMRLQSETTSVFVENVASVQGLSFYHFTLFDYYHQHKCSLASRKFKAAYNKALCLEQKTTSGLNSLLAKLSSWVASDVQGIPDDVLPDVIVLEQLREQWVRARDVVSAALATLENKPAQQLFYRSSLLASTRPRSLRRWTINFVRLFMIQ